jgi:DNA-binding MarR family transcriptional regulator
MFVLELGRYVAEAYRQQGRYIQENLSPLGISLRSFPFYLLLAQEGPLTPSEMTAKLHADKTKTAKALRALEELSYIERIPDQEDRRVKRLRLTAKGRAVYPEVRSVLDRMDSAVDDLFSREELLRTGEILDSYSEALKQLNDRMNTDEK